MGWKLRRAGVQGREVGLMRRGTGAGKRAGGTAGTRQGTGDRDRSQSRQDCRKYETGLGKGNRQQKENRINAEVA